MELDGDDFVFYGTPIEREEDVTTRKKKAVAEAFGNLRTLVPWKQEVRDEEGRRRFHGAFSGGFSAGYYNTVGSKEGWTPQSFVSSRKNRAEVKQQNFLNFLDEDERAELEGQSLGTSMQFDTFGLTAAELARKQAEKEQQKRPSAIPGPVPDELVLPSTDSIGVKLLLKMGWRHGRSIKDSHTNKSYDARREARKAFLAFSSSDAKTQFADSGPVHGELENYIEQPTSDDVQSSQSTPVYVLYPKQDLHGLGFDPYKHAPEFREKKRSRLSENRGIGSRSARSTDNNLFGFKSGKVAPGFGIGALEELDAEDEDVYASGYDFEETYVEDIDEPSRSIMDSKQKPVRKEPGVLSGFRLASNSDYQHERFDPPNVPKDFVPLHKFLGPVETVYKIGDPGPPEVPPPEDNNLKVLIDGVATLVARCGKLFEDLSREKNHSNPLFSFLVGGNGHEYYARKLWEEQQKQGDHTKKMDGKLSPRMQKMTAESRGKILGERPLERSSKDSSSSVASEDAIQLQYNLSDTFTKPALHGEMLEAAKPFKDDPEKQERFERFLKEKYQGGLRSTESGGSSHMSEAVRARERLDFEAAAETIQKGNWSKETKLSTSQFMEYLSAGGMQFTSGGLAQAKGTQAESITKEVQIKRTEYQWRPSPILCRRFDLIDPYLGKPPPAPRMKSKMETLIFTSDSGKNTKAEEVIFSKRDSFPVAQLDAQGISKDVADKESGVEVEVENVERPVDLYKAIFSDDSDDEEDTSIPNETGNPEKKVEAANTTLNRLIAGDFLESLGKELGLEVPPELTSSMNKVGNSAPPKGTAATNFVDSHILQVDNKPSSTLEILHSKEIAQDGPHGDIGNGNLTGNSARSNSKFTDTGSFGNQFDKIISYKVPQEDRQAKTPSRQHQKLSSSSSSEDERSRKHSRRHRHRQSGLDSDSSSDDRDRYRSRSQGRKKQSSREKSSSSSRKHSKHHKRRSRDSPEKERSETKREKHRRD